MVCYCASAWPMALRMSEMMHPKGRLVQRNAMEIQCKEQIRSLYSLKGRDRNAKDQGA